MPRGYWGVSLAAAVLLLVYAASTLDPILVAGPAVSALIFARNLRLSRQPGGSAGLPLLLVAPALLLVSVAALGPGLDSASASTGWVVVGLLGQELWTSRNVIQWWASERQGVSVLPPAYFAVGAAGALLLLAYAVHRMDWVFIAAYALNPIPYGRNLWLSVRRPRQKRPAPELLVAVAGERA